MGLPQINIVFEGLANTIKFRSERGIVAIILKDETATKTSYVYRKLEDIKDNIFSEKNMEYLGLVFKGKPNKVIIEVINSENSRTIDTVLKDLELKKFNYLSYPVVSEEEITKIKTWIENKRSIGKKIGRAHV